MICKLDIEKAYDNVKLGGTSEIVEENGFWGEIVLLDSNLYLYSSIFFVGQWVSS